MGEAKKKDGVIVKVGEGEEQPAPAETPAAATFNVSEGVNTVTIEARRNGVTYKLTHKLREPTSAEWKEFQRRMLKQKGKNASPNILESREWLYGELAIEAQGYSEGSQPLDFSGKNWLRQIPILHKSVVISRIAEIASDDDEEDFAEASVVF